MALRTLPDANRDSREMRGAVDTSLLGLARGTTLIASWKNGLTTEQPTRSQPRLATRRIKFYWIWNLYWALPSKLLSLARREPRDAKFTYPIERRWCHGSGCGYLYVYIRHLSDILRFTVDI